MSSCVRRMPKVFSRIPSVSLCVCCIPRVFCRITSVSVYLSYSKGILSYRAFVFVFVAFLGVFVAFLVFWCVCKIPKIILSYP